MWNVFCNENTGLRDYLKVHFNFLIKVGQYTDTVKHKIIITLFEIKQNL